MPPSQNLLRAGHVPVGCISFQARAMAAAASRAPSQLARRDALSLTASAPRLSDLLSNSRSGDAADWQVACELRRAAADEPPRGQERGLAPRPASCCVARDRPTGDRQRPSAQQLNWAQMNGVRTLVVIAVARCIGVYHESGCESGSTRPSKCFVCGRIRQYLKQYVSAGLCNISYGP